MQNREELRQKNIMGVKNNGSREGEKYHCQKGGGGIIIFGPKYGPLGHVPVVKNHLFHPANLKYKRGYR
jgi:hypothetical protein